MSFVFYDLETTGLSKRFDQILQFAAVRTDADLVIRERMDVRIRLMPHVIPSPAALHINRLDISEITDPALPSNYQAISEINAKLRAWSPSLFLGYNSLQFDEEFLRQALYMNLHPPYLTNTNGNARADALKLVRAVAVLAPRALVVPTEEGRPSFRLSALATANGYVGGAAHNAANDVDATVHLCRLVADRAPEVWSQLMRFSTRQAVTAFMSDEDAFVFFDQIGAVHSTHVVTSIGVCKTNPSMQFCFDLKSDPEAVAAMDPTTLACLPAHEHPLRRLRTNAAPMLAPLYDAPADVLDGLCEEDYATRARSLIANPGLKIRLAELAQALEKQFEPSPHVEEQIYSGTFPSQAEAEALRQFHAVDWQHRREAAEALSDDRHRAIALRLMFLEQPELLSEPHRIRISDAISLRLRGEGNPQPPCRTVREALAEIKNLEGTNPDVAASRRIMSLAEHLGRIA